MREMRREQQQKSRERERERERETKKTMREGEFDFPTKTITSSTKYQGRREGASGASVQNRKGAEAREG